MLLNDSQLKLMKLESKLDELIGMYGIQLKYDEEGQFRGRIGIGDHGYSVIELHKDFRRPEMLLSRIIVKVHELGHFLSYVHSFNRNHPMWMLEKTIDTIGEEKRAWLAAYEVLVSLGFRHWKGFSSYGRWSLSSYYGVCHNPKEGVYHEEAEEFFSNLLADLSVTN